MHEKPHRPVQPATKRATSPSRGRVYVGTIGAPCDVVVAVNRQPIPAEGQVRLTSGASLRIGQDGAWVYRSRTIDRGLVGVDGFQYTLQTPAGIVEGEMQITQTPLENSSRPVFRTADSRPLRGTGTSYDPWQLDVQLLTGMPRLLELRTNRAANQTDERSVVLLDQPAGITSEVLSDGMVRVAAQGGFYGQGVLAALVETEAGLSEWVDVHLEVKEACEFADSQNGPQRDRHREKTLATPFLMKRIIAVCSTPVFRGRCRPGQQVTARLDTSTSDISAQTCADAAGYWSLTLRGVPQGRPCDVAFESNNGTGTSGVDLQLDPPSNSGYREVH